MRAIAYLDLCEVRGDMNPETCTIIREHGKSALREIGRLCTTEAMLAAAKRAAAEIAKRMTNPRAGWDVYGTGKRNQPRLRIREVITDAISEKQ